MAGYPLGEPTTLPKPSLTIAAQDVEILKSLLSLSVYKDSSDDKKYYYVPPFRVLPYDQGAASLQAHTVKADNVFQADSIMKRMQSEALVPESVMNDPVLASKRDDFIWATQRLKKQEEKYEEKMEKIEEFIAETEEKLEKAEAEQNERLTKFYQKKLEEKKNDIIEKTEGIKRDREEYQAKKNEFDLYSLQVIEKWNRQKLFQVTTYLASAGRSIDLKNYPETEDLISAINNAIDELKRSNGGFLSMNIYSGFTEKQLNEIRLLKTKYWPDINLSLMAANDLTFIPLAQLENAKNGVRENTMFKEVNGSGGYHGATVNFDLTIDGAASLSMNLGPFVLPVGIKAVIREKIAPFHGKVMCDFTNYIKTKGRADVVDGWWFFDKDITNNIKTNSDSSGACEIEVFKGDPESAHFFALEKIKEGLEKKFIRQTQLSQNEAKAFHQSVMSELEVRKFEASLDDKKDDSNWWATIVDTFTGRRIISSLGGGGQSYWHTSKYDTGRAEDLKFEEIIDMPGLDEVRKQVPATLCLFYNAQKHAYDRCTRAQEEMAENVTAATVQAYASPECKDAKSIQECKKMREEKALELKPQQEEKVVDNHLHI